MQPRWGGRYVYGTKDRYADAAADGELTAMDPTGITVWSKVLTVSVNGLTEYLVSRR
jgi:hypothetical protein